MYAATLLTAASALLSPVSSMTLTADNEHTITVSAADLDLAQPQHAARFNRRIHTAIRRVCTETGVLDTKGQGARFACIKDTSTRVRPEVDQIIAAASAAGGARVAVR